MAALAAPPRWQPATTSEAADCVREARAAGVCVDVMGGGSLREFGAPRDAAAVLCTAHLTGVVLAEPAELVWSARAGTPLIELHAALAAAGQMLAFEPPNWGPLLGNAGASQTIGGVIAANLSGPRRVRAGAARDHLLGARFIDGNGEMLRAGGRVVKNVTGYDVPKLLAGSFGTLGLMTEVTIKALPQPASACTLLAAVPNLVAAHAAMARALASPHEVSGAAYLPEPIAARSALAALRAAGGAVVALRLEGFEPSVVYRAQCLRALFPSAIEVDTAATQILWREIADVAYFVADARPLWRLCVAPGELAGVLARLQRELALDYFADWAGGLVWLAIDGEHADAGAARIRASFAAGHATLIRAPAAIRARVPVFQPQAAALAAVTRGVRSAFDAAGVFNTGRMASGA